MELARGAKGTKGEWNEQVNKQKMNATNLIRSLAVTRCRLRSTLCKQDVLKQ